MPATLLPASSIQPMLTAFTEAQGRIPTEAEVVVMLARQGWRLVPPEDCRQAASTLIFRGCHYTQ